jgi:Domain of unknown function (DUF4157)
MENLQQHRGTSAESTPASSDLSIKGKARPEGSEQEASEHEASSHEGGNRGAGGESERAGSWEPNADLMAAMGLDATGGASEEKETEEASEMPNLAAVASGAAGGADFDIAVARKAASADSLTGLAVGATVDRAQSSSSGQPLDASTKQEMEGGFGRSFDDVRVHTDGAAASAAGDLNARAFTVGSDVYFGQGTYDPAGASGKHLVAHELAHVAQGGSVAAKGTGDGASVSSPGDAAEVEADRAADIVVAGGKVSGLSSGGSGVYRDALGDLDKLSSGNWIGNVDEDEALRKLAALSAAEKVKLATDASYHPMLTRLCRSFNAAEMIRLFAAIPQIDLRWRMYWLIIANVHDELTVDQWRRVIGTASPAEMDALRQYPEGYRAFLRNGPDNLVPPWDRLQGLKQGWWTGDPAKIRFAVNSLSAAQRTTIRADDALCRAIMNGSGTAAEKFRTATYLEFPLKWAVFYLSAAAALSSLTSPQWSQMLSEAPKAELDELVGWAEMWALAQKHCPPAVLQLVRQNTQNPNTVTAQLQDPVSLGLLISSLGPAAVLALSTQAGTDVAVNYGHIKTNSKVHPILDGLERGMRLGERTSAALKQWFVATTGETDIPTLEKMMSIRFGTTVGGTGGPGASAPGGVHAGSAIQPWSLDGLRSAWTILERLPPGMAESNPAFLHLLRDGGNGGYYAGRDTSAGWDNSVVAGLSGPANGPGAVMSGDAIYGGTMSKFNEVMRHEMGHAVDNQLTITASIQNEEWAGAWVNHGGPAGWVDALIKTGGGLSIHGYPATDVGDYRAAMINAATNATLFLTELNAIRAAKSPPLPALASAPTTGPVSVLNNLATWHHASRFWSASAWQPQNQRNFVRGYGDSHHWWSFSNATMTAHRATNYQWRAPKEWFAECYAVYYSEQEAGGNVPVGTRLRGVDRPSADFISAQVDRGYSPQALSGGAGNVAADRAAPGTPGGVGGTP